MRNRWESATGGAQFSVIAPDLFLRHATVYGTAMGSPADFRDMVAFVAAHNLKPVIDKSFDLESAAQALLYLESGHRLGKVVITI